MRTSKNFLAMPLVIILSPRMFLSRKRLCIKGMICHINNKKDEQPIDNERDCCIFKSL